MNLFSISRRRRRGKDEDDSKAATATTKGSSSSLVTTTTTTTTTQRSRRLPGLSFDLDSIGGMKKEEGKEERLLRENMKRLLQVCGKKEREKEKSFFSKRFWSWA